MSIHSRYKRMGAIATAAALTCMGLAAAPAAAAPNAPKNIIFMIGDGMGYNSVDLANLLQKGETHYQVETGPDRKPLIAGSNVARPSTGFQSWDLYGMSTHWLEGNPYDPAKAWSDFDWVKHNYTDSAAAGTAMATGVKTYNAGLGVDGSGKVVENVSERAKALGKAAGVVSSVPVNHATPAAFSVHNSSRNNLHEILTSQIASDMDVIIGTGHPLFDDNAQAAGTPKTTYVPVADYERLSSGATPWSFVEKKADFEALESGAAPAKLFGIAQVYSTLQQARTDEARNDVPTLETLTNVALNVLEEDKDGFMLMVEGGAIDWTGHQNQTKRMAEETVEFFDAVEAAIDWVETNSNWDETLMIVSADHETGYLQGPAAPPWTAMTLGAEGELPAVSWHSDQHTNQLVPFFVTGAGSKDLGALATGFDQVRGRYLDNTTFAQWVLNTAWSDGEDPDPEPEVKKFSKTSAPTISGTATVGKTLKAAVKSWKPGAAYSFKWLRNGKTISGATGTTYKLTTADVGKKISVKVTGSKAGYKSVSKTSKSVKVSKAVASVKVSVPSSVKKGKQATIKVSVSAATSKPTGKVTVKVNGKTVTKSVKASANGKVSVKLPKINKKGSYKVKVSFKPSGDTAKSTSSSKSVSKTLKVK
ncbi:alkaline phosphatase [Tessaracoccus caeni]|uniref:alkaline phosphatase n=1 Tax=Tessaracoccus caeni TaxID=3031239 RepID=UPI0023DAFB7F|nr:alkaline phosphatase [Tessaracoccus caeni]MDF1488204.1 alkaline phosphatase [Tessaracoccus caeni]